MFSSLVRKIAAVTLVAAPLGAGSSLVASAVIGTPAAHAASGACIDINPTGAHAGPCSAPSSPGSTTANDPSTAAINVCTGGASDSGAWGAGSAPAGSIVVANSGNTQVWANTTGPIGQAEVDGIGIASDQTGCV